MPWFRLDDNFDTHPKVISAGNEAIGLYIRCGAYAARHLTDGFVPRDTALLYGSPALVETLVRTRLWRRVRGGWMMHDYLNYNPSKEAVQRERASSARRQALFRDPALKQAVRSRDGNACRYCGRTVRWGKGQAADSGTYDHVDPAGPNTIENLVVACNTCNAKKRDRTAVEMGMALLPAPQQASRNASVNRDRNVSPPTPTRTSYGSTNGSARGTAAAARATGKPPWCGTCDERTRLTDDPDNPQRCPYCHPLTQRSMP